MAGFFSVSVSSVLEDVLEEHGARLSDMDLAWRKEEEAAGRRYEAARWIRRTVGVVGSKDLPEEPSEDEFRLCLRNGLILCNVLNKVHPGSIPKVVAAPGDSVLTRDGAALSAYQYFENIRNFLVVIQDMSLPTFEASDLEQGGKTSRIVNCILALKSYSEWKQTGGIGSWKFSRIVKPVVSGRTFMRKNSDPFSLARSQLYNDRESVFAEQNSSDEEFNNMSSHSLNFLVHSFLSDKKPEEVPVLVESVLCKVMEEFERQITCQNELVKTAMSDLKHHDNSSCNVKILADPVSASLEIKDIEINECTRLKKENFQNNLLKREASKKMLLKQFSIIDKQQRDIQLLRHGLQTTRDEFKFMQSEYSEELHIIRKHMHNFANAASGYHEVLEENRKLYNQIQDLKGSIRVYCRVKPFLPGQVSRSTIGSIDEGNITIITPEKYGREGQRTFTFNKVFGPYASQEDVFVDTQPLIRSVLDGYNVCIFAFGQTGSGKTYTMSGPKELNRHNVGVNYRALNDLFDLVEMRRGTFSYEISVQMIEIYNEQVRDLLISDGLTKRLEIRNGSQNGFNVPSANLVPVSSTADVIELMNTGQRNRVVGSTALNDRSSRSHSCMTVHIEGRDLISGVILRGCMHLVDLAGSERVDKSKVTGERLKEAQHINKSLSALGDVISSLAQKNSHVPFRNSKLTQLLQDSLGGQAKTLMFVHISPEMDSLGETISTLKFAERVATVELGVAQLNKECSDAKELKEQIASLKAELARREGGSEQTLVPTPDLCKTMTKIDVSSHLSRRPMEEVGNIEAQSDFESRQSKPSFDLQQVPMANDTLSWPDFGSGGDDKQVSRGDWVDKIMVKKHENSLCYWDRDGDGEILPDFFYQRCVDRADQGQPCNIRGNQREDDFGIERHHSPLTMDGSDNVDVAASDSSEVDTLWQLDLSKSACRNDSGGSKIKKPQIKPAKNPYFRTPTRVKSRIPRQPSSGVKDVKRASSSGGKLSSEK